jgi:integrase
MPRNGLPKYCCWAVDRHGKRRVRFRRNGCTTYLSGTPWSEGFMRQYAELVDRNTPAIGESRTTHGSFNALVVAYYGASEFTNLAESTRRARRNILERFRAEHGTKQLKGLGRVHIKAILDQIKKREARNHLLKVLRGILEYAVDQEMLPTNPAAGIKKLKNQSDGHHTWTEQEILQFQNRHPTGSKAALALALGLFTAQRKGDCLRMGWQHVTGDTIAVRQEKTKTPLVIPLHPELKAALASVPRANLTFIVTEWGAPFTSAGFGNWFRDQCNAAGLQHCSFHGLRKAAATRLSNAGCTPDEVKAITGHRSLAEVARYTKANDQRLLAQKALAKQLRAEGEQFCPTIEAPLSNRKAK